MRRLSSVLMFVVSILLSVQLVSSLPNKMIDHPSPSMINERERSHSTVSPAGSLLESLPLKTTPTAAKDKRHVEQLIIIPKNTPPPCCVAGKTAGNWGYLCQANKRFVSERYFLPHPFKVKLNPRRPRVQLDLAQKIQACSRFPPTARLYERCCEHSQHKLYQRMGLES